MQLEKVLAAQDRLLRIVCRKLLYKLAEYLHTLVNCLCEALFFGLDDLLYIFSLFVKLGISCEVFVYNRVAYLIEEGSVYAEHSAVSCGTS